FSISDRWRHSMDQWLCSGLFRARQNQDGPPVRKQRDERAKNNDDATEPNPLHEWIQVRMDDGQLRVWTLPSIDDVQIFTERRINRHHGAGFAIGLEDAALRIEHHQGLIVDEDFYIQAEPGVVCFRLAIEALENEFVLPQLHG